MDVRYVNPFMESVDNVFATMLDLQVSRMKPKLSKAGAAAPPNGAWLTSLVGFSGQATGAVALRFPVPTALAVAGRMLGTELTEVNDETIDAISELANMVAGAAKAKFDINPPPSLSLPTVVHGSDYRTAYPSDARWLEIPFSTVAGEFNMEVTFSAPAGSA